ncbi:hypothetical protein [Spirosoma sp. 48-14]|uniref:hypothetical protein n=1 Tax=Spirosoma sp. 48-14 TaxID=1895854 RepID=UPI00095C328D|nr:hypothetical protein [Spirosoma sp. 48-14]OJW78419.1 MAG: hypothetical protein BGO59_30935 [Spirosoma sp. 48-14]
MNQVISEGDRVQVTRIIKGYERGKYNATVLNWTPNGLLKVKNANDGTVKNVSSNNVKKRADKPKTL